MSKALPSPNSSAEVVLPVPAERSERDESGERGPVSFTTEQRISLAMACIPLVRALRRRISAYSLLWCAAGFVIALLAIPALVKGHAFLSLTALIYGGSLLVFSLMRIFESRTLAALTEVGRSGLRRKIWLGFNLIILVSALTTLIVALVSSGKDTAWVTIPCSIFVIIVSVSPAWEWFFVHRVITQSKELVTDFCRSIGDTYINPEESPAVPALLEALHLLAQLHDKGHLRMETFAAVRAELIGLTSPAAPATDATVSSAKPW